MVPKLKSAPPVHHLYPTPATTTTIVRPSSSSIAACLTFLTVSTNLIIHTNHTQQIPKLLHRPSSPVAHDDHHHNQLHRDISRPFLPPQQSTPAPCKSKPSHDLLLPLPFPFPSIPPLLTPPSRLFSCVRDNRRALFVSSFLAPPPPQKLNNYLNLPPKFSDGYKNVPQIRRQHKWLQEHYKAVAEEARGSNLQAVVALVVGGGVTCREEKDERVG